MKLAERADTKEIVIRIDPKYFRPAEVDQLIGDPSKAYKKLGWNPSINLEKLVEEMINEDKKIVKAENILSEKGFRFNKSLGNYLKFYE